MWPDNWDRPDQSFGKGWMESHIADASLLGKPLVLEEFGEAPQSPSTHNRFFLLEAKILSVHGLAGPLHSFLQTQSMR